MPTLISSMLSIFENALAMRMFQLFSILFLSNISHFLIALIPDTTFNLMGNFVFTNISRSELERDEMIWCVEVRDGMKTTIIIR